MQDPTTDNNSLAAFQRLSDILDTLRRKCPWDRAQTLQSLRYLTIEEVHELSEAIVALTAEAHKGQGATNPDAAGESPAAPTPDPGLRPLCTALMKELGDLAMHVMFYCKIAEDQGLFSQADVYNGVCDKLVDRHPFIYRKDDYHGESWEQLKMREKDHRQVLDGVPDSLPSMVKAVRMQEKVAGRATGRPDGDIGLRPAVEPPADTDTEAFGDLLFALVDWARRHGINADDALSLANRKFRLYQSAKI